MKYEEYLLSEIRRFHREHGRVPVSRDFKKGSGYPSIQSYRNHFNQWSDAVRLAGFEPKKVAVVNLSLPKFIRKSTRSVMTCTRLKNLEE